MRKKSSIVTPDDFELEQDLMAVRYCGPPSFVNGQQCGRNDLSGIVMKLKAVNLPFILVGCSCPIRGQQDLIIDVREYEFIRVSAEFVQAVLDASQTNCESEIENEVLS